MKPLEKNVLKTAELLKALGHPARVEILRMISGAKERRLTVKQVHEHLDIPQPEASRHLLLMKGHSILCCERKDGYSFYRLNDSVPLLKNLLALLKK